MDFSSGTTHGDLGATGTPSHVNRRLSAHKLGTQVKLLYRSLKTVMITTELYNFDIKSYPYLDLVLHCLDVHATTNKQEKK